MINKDPNKLLNKYVTQTYLSEEEKKIIWNELLSPNSPIVKENRVTHCVYIKCLFGWSWGLCNIRWQIKQTVGLRKRFLITKISNKQGKEK